MAMVKRYTKDKKACRVKFILPKEIAENFREVSIVGDFNNWDPHKNKMTHKNGDGSICIELDFEAGNEYHFKYLCDNEVWLNEPEADELSSTHYSNTYNSVIRT